MRRTAIVSVFGAFVAYSSSVFAADLPRPTYKAAPYASPAAYNWTGFYVGAHAGYGWSNYSGTDPFGASTGQTKGFLGGFQLGYNYQFDSFVIGIEGDYSFANVNFTVDDPFGLGGGQASLKNDFFATGALRFGYAFDRYLVYAKGGGAWTRDKLDVTDGIGGAANGTWNRTGWMVGAGLEYALLDKWSVKLEYNYLSFPSISETPSTSGGLTATTSNVPLVTYLVKLGVNYRFY